MKYESVEEIRDELAKLGLTFVKLGYGGGDFFVSVEENPYFAAEKMKENPNWTVVKVEKFYNDTCIQFY